MASRTWEMEALALLFVTGWEMMVIGIWFVASLVTMLN